MMRTMKKTLSGRNPRVKVWAVPIRIWMLPSWDIRTSPVPVTLVDNITRTDHASVITCTWQRSKVRKRKTHSHLPSFPEIRGAEMEEGSGQTGPAQQLHQLLPRELKDQQEARAAQRTGVLILLWPLRAPVFPALHAGDDESYEDLLLVALLVPVLQYVWHLGNMLLFCDDCDGGYHVYCLNLSS